MLDIDELFYDIYLTATGNLLPGHKYPGIPNEFAPGGVCYESFEEVEKACDRILKKLNAPGDEDLEIIIEAFTDMEAALCHKMFCYGMRAASLLE